MLDRTLRLDHRTDKYGPPRPVEYSAVDVSGDDGVKLG